MLKRSILALIVVVIVILVAAGLLIAMQPAANNTTNITNASNTTVINQTNNQTHNNTTTSITAAKAKELAQKYIGMGVYLGNATLTTYKGVKVWNVTVYTTQGKYTDSIYINANSGNKVT
jgi:hypothetical protein